jgi:hypothetical protein
VISSLTDSANLAKSGESSGCEDHGARSDPRQNKPLASDASKKKTIASGIRSSVHPLTNFRQVLRELNIDGGILTANSLYRRIQNRIKEDHNPTGLSFP